MNTPCVFNAADEVMMFLDHNCVDAGQNKNTDRARCSPVYCNKLRNTQHQPH